MEIDTAIFVAAGVTTALTTGLLFAFSVAVNLGLGKLTDKEYLRAMKSINREIKNPIFGLCFFGSTILLPITSFLYRHDSNRFPLLLAATLIYVIGQFIITLTRNVPLNDRLDKTNLETSSNEELSVIRNWYEGPWNRWNHFRVIAGTLSLALIYYAAITI